MELGWIDFTEEERRNTLSVLAFLKEPTAVDELGIGVVRDALADKLFPGTSTLLRKTKYFFLVAYALYDMELEGGGSLGSSALRSSYDDTERDVAIRLLRGGESEGVIGRRSLRSDFSGPWVSRGPGEIYWAPLRSYGFFKHPSYSYADYFGYLSSLPARTKAQASTGDTGAADDVNPVGSLWSFPKEPWKNWRANLSGELTKDEAVYLKNQILSQHGDSLMAELLRDGMLRHKALAVFNAVSADEQAVLEADGVFNKFYEDAKGLLAHKPGLADLCRIAAIFSGFVYACRLRYNYQIPQNKGDAESEWGQYKAAAYQYAQELDIDELYGQLDFISATAHDLRVRFLVPAQQLLSRGDAGIPALDELIRTRERQIKRGRSKIGNADLQDVAWRGGRYLPYRFYNGVRIINDIAKAGGFDA